MTLLWLNLTLVFIFSFFSRYFAKSVTTGGSILPIKPNKLMIFGIMATLIVFSGMRNNIGDTDAYIYSYELHDYTWEVIKEQKDIGFGILQMILQIFSKDAQVLIFCTALITNFLIVSVLVKYSRVIELSTYVYITCGLYLVSMNGIRQVLAASIIFTATRFVISGNWLMYFLIVLFASTFHQSALILLPIYFLSRYKAWSRATIFLLFFSVLIALGYNEFSGLLFKVIEDTQYGNYSSFDEGGANFIRVVVYAAPLFIAYLGREKLRELFPSSDYIVNLALVGMIFMIISTQNWIFARFSIYFNLYQLILVSWIVKLFKEKEQRFVYFIILICYLAYYYYESVISLNIYYKSEFFGT